MAAKRPTPRELRGRFIRLNPLTRDELPALFTAIAHPRVFEGGFGGGPAGYRDSLPAFIAWAETYFAWTDGNVYVARTLADDTVVGTSTLGDFDEAWEHTHIGWTAWSPSVWGTMVNPEAKLLMLGEAFDAGFGRVKIQADVRNERSRAAIARLGATFEGIVRRDMPRADGSWRDTAVFSVIIDDWPRVKAGLLERLTQGASPR